MSINLLVDVCYGYCLEENLVEVQESCIFEPINHSVRLAYIGLSAWNKPF